MSENFSSTEGDLTKKIYEDTILNGRFSNSRIVNDLSGRLNIYGERRQIETILKAETASTIISLVPGGDEEVAKGITIGIELAKPNFGKVGEEFLLQHVPGYKKSDFGVALTRVMLAGLTGERIDRIQQGVQDFLEGRTNVSEEVKAAKMATLIYCGANKFRDRLDFNAVHTTALSRVLEATEENKTVTTSDREYLKKLAELKSQKDLLARNPRRKQELEASFKYFSSNFDEIPEGFRTALEGYSRQAIIAYYVASIREDEVSRIYETQAKDIVK